MSGIVGVMGLLFLFFFFQWCARRRAVLLEMVVVHFCKRRRFRSHWLCLCFVLVFPVGASLLRLYALSHAGLLRCWHLTYQQTQRKVRGPLMDEWAQNVNVSSIHATAGLASHIPISGNN